MARQSKVPKALQPMLATLIDAPFDSRDWVFESKWDGFRLVAKIEKGRVTLYSRSGLIVSDNYKPIANALEKLRQDAVIDGELVALDAHGVSRFQLLQNALRTSANLHYCVFDIMFLGGEDLRGLPLRKERLRSILPKKSGFFQLSGMAVWFSHSARKARPPRRTYGASFKKLHAVLTDWQLVLLLETVHERNCVHVDFERYSE